jgi:uncharacterized protein YbjT (DUF2867 family)
MPLADDIQLQLAAVDDIGAVAAAAIIDPSRVPGGAVEIAGTFGWQAGLPARFQSLPLEAAGNNDQQAMFARFAKPPSYRADRALTGQLDPHRMKGARNEF